MGRARQGLIQGGVVLIFAAAVVTKTLTWLLLGLLAALFVIILFAVAGDWGPS